MVNEGHLKLGNVVDIDFNDMFELPTFYQQKTHPQQVHSNTI